jgi:IS605 OrfB family transposase
MGLISSYGVQIKNIDFNIRDTVNIYREAVAFCIDICDKEWINISTIKKPLERKTFVENLIHSTKTNTAKYDFDKRFYKFPSYLRRDVIASAIGAVSSYKSNLANWISNPIGEEPTLTYDHNMMPVFYKKNMYLTSDDPYSCQIKVYINKDWVWRTIKLVKTDVKYIQKHMADLEQSAPTLEKRFGTYYLRFAFEELVFLGSANVKDQTICSVDLGLNSDAVCTIMTSDGTVHARKFINFSCEKDQLWHLCNRIKKQQRKYGPQSVKKKWSYATYLNNELSVKIATEIVEFAKLHEADVIVFEYLDMKSKKNRGKHAQRLHLWRKNGIQELVTHKAHKNGMRISRICAWGTSKLAFDGSGEVTRDKNNRALATFKNGKQYNSDLSASYNIGARYFIRELLKPIAATQRSPLLAEVPEAERRTSCTYHTLLQLNEAFKELGIAV